MFYDVSKQPLVLVLCALSTHDQHSAYSFLCNDRWSVCVLALWVPGGVTFSMYKEEIPNGDHVPHPCKANFIWHGVGHQNALGGGAKNPFGEDFSAHGKKVCTLLRLLQLLLSIGQMLSLLYFTSSLTTVAHLVFFSA